MMESRDLKAIGQSLVASRRFADAIQVFEKLLGRDPEDVYSLDMLGFLYYQTGNVTEALARCERSIALAPESFYGLKGYGLCLVKAGRVDEGLGALRRSIALKPDYFDARHDLGVTLMGLGRLDEAREAFEGAREVAPGRAAQIDRALAALEKRRRESAGQ